MCDEATRSSDDGACDLLMCFLHFALEGQRKGTCRSVKTQPLCRVVVGY